MNTMTLTVLVGSSVVVVVVLVAVDVVVWGCSVVVSDGGLLPKTSR